MLARNYQDNRLTFQGKIVVACMLAARLSCILSLIQQANKTNYVSYNFQY